MTISQSWTRGVLAMVATAVYLPCVIGFFADCGHCRKLWANLLPALPGILAIEGATRALGTGRLEDAPLVMTATSVTWALIIGLTWLGRRGWRWLAVSLVLGFGMSLVSCVGILVAIRS